MLYEWVNGWGDLLKYRTSPEWRSGYQQAMRDTMQKISAPGVDSDPDHPSGASAEGNDADTGAENITHRAAR
jgi:hypothetical protein